MSEGSEKDFFHIAKHHPGRWSQTGTKVSEASTQEVSPMKGRGFCRPGWGQASEKDIKWNHDGEKKKKERESEFHLFIHSVYINGLFTMHLVLLWDYSMSKT